MPRRRRPRINRHYKIDHALPPDEREAYLAFLREPPTTIDLAHAWLADRGHRTFSRSAVARHRRHSLEAIERRQQAADAAVQFAALARDGQLPADALIVGMAAQSEALLVNALVEAPLRGRKLSLEELDELGDLVSRMVKTRQQVFELERQIAAAGGTTAASRFQPAPAPPTPAEEQEETVRRICAILNHPYPAQGAEGKAGTATLGSERNPSIN